MKTILTLILFTLILYLHQKYLTRSPNYSLQPYHSNYSNLRRLLYQQKQLKLINHHLTGTWTSLNQTKQFDFFDSQSGQAHQYFYFNNSDRRLTEQAHVNRIMYIFLDPKYLNEKLAQLVITVDNTFNATTSNWQGNNVSMVQYLYYNYDLISESIVNSSFIINQTYSQINSSMINLELINHAIKYSLILPLVMIIPSLLMLLSLYFVQKNQIPYLKISLVTLILTLNFTIFLALFEFYEGVYRITTNQKYFLITGIVTMTCSIRFMKTFQNVFKNIIGIRGYLTYYVISFLYIWALFSFYNKNWFSILNSLVLLPQIIHNAYTGIKPGFYISYYLVIIINQIYMIYSRGCPQNIFLHSPNLLICVGIVVSIILQLIFLYIQHIYGSRFFIPKKLIPGYYDYFEEIMVNDIKQKLLEEDCAICFTSLYEQSQDILDIQKPQVQKFVKQKKIKLMKTPCNHRFHVHCLQSWMEHKLECPIDRCKLPPIS